MTDPEIIQLCREIYARHQRAIDLIVQYGFTDRVGELVRLVLEEDESLPVNLLDSRSGSTWFVPQEWEECLRPFGPGWGPTVPYGIACWFSHPPRRDKLAFLIEVGPISPPDERRRLVQSLDQAQFKRTGFSGLFLPVLEDVVLAKRAAEGILHVKDLLMYSAVCGTGLDTIPLPGVTSQEALTGILLDLATLALRLDKPLTARLMPIPGKKAGDLTRFDFAYFANSRVLAVNAETLDGLLAGDETIPLQPRNAYMR